MVGVQWNIKHVGIRRGRMIIALRPALACQWRPNQLRHGGEGEGAGTRIRNILPSLRFLSGGGCIEEHWSRERSVQKGFTSSWISFSPSPRRLLVTARPCRALPHPEPEVPLNTRDVVGRGVTKPSMTVLVHAPTL